MRYHEWFMRYHGKVGTWSIPASKTCHSTDIDSDRENQSSQRLIFESFQLLIRLNEIDTVLLTDV